MIAGEGWTGAAERSTFRRRAQDMAQAGDMDMARPRDMARLGPGARPGL